MFKNLAIGKKIGLVFLVILLLMLLVGGLAYHSLDNASDGFNRYRATARSANSLGAFQNDLLLMRFDAKAYVVSGNPELKERVIERGEHLQKVLQQVKQRSSDAEYAQSVDELIKFIDQYEEVFTQVSTMQEEKKRIITGTLRVVGPAIVQDLTDIMVSAEEDNDMTAAFHTGMGLRNFLLARIYVNEFLTLRDQASLDKIHEQLAKMDEALTVLNRDLENAHRRDLLNETLKAKEEYGAAVAIVERIISDQKELQVVADTQVGPGMANAIGEIRNSIVKEQDELGPKLVAANGKSIRFILIIIAVATILGISIAFVLTRMITRPLKTVVALSERAGSGDLTFTRKDFNHDATDELGQMADALAAMIATQRDAVRAIIGEARNTVESAQSLAALSEETNASVEEVKSAVEQVATMSEANSAALEETNAGVQEVSTSATNSARASAEGASASGKTIEVARGAVNQVNTVIDDIEVVGTKSEVVETTINELAKAVNSISGFVATITGIADQTNLLALNAAIEAARAGDAGRGFAVVADEVRKLAEESGKAANEVGTLISSLQSGAQQALSVTSETGSIMGKTVQKARDAQTQLTAGLNEVAKISDVMQNIAAGAQEQAAAAEQMAAGVDQVSTATVQVVEAVANIRANSDETAKASEGVAGHAQALTSGAERMQELLAQFRVDESAATAEA